MEKVTLEYRVNDANVRKFIKRENCSGDEQTNDNNIEEKKQRLEANEIKIKSEPQEVDNQICKFDINEVKQQNNITKEVRVRLKKINAEKFLRKQAKRMRRDKKKSKTKPKIVVKTEPACDNGEVSLNTKETKKDDIKIKTEPAETENSSADVNNTPTVDKITIKTEPVDPLELDKDILPRSKSPEILPLEFVQPEEDNAHLPIESTHNEITVDNADSHNQHLENGTSSEFTNINDPMASEKIKKSKKKFVSFHDSLLPHLKKLKLIGVCKFEGILK